MTGHSPVSLLSPCSKMITMFVMSDHIAACPPLIPSSTLPHPINLYALITPTLHLSIYMYIYMYIYIYISSVILFISLTMVISAKCFFLVYDVTLSLISPQCSTPSSGSSLPCPTRPELAPSHSPPTPHQPKLPAPSNSSTLLCLWLKRVHIQ